MAILSEISQTQCACVASICAAARLDYNTIFAQIFLAKSWLRACLIIILKM